MGLAVVLEARPDGAGPQSAARLAVRVRGGRPPVRLYLYRDGDLLDVAATREAHAFQTPPAQGRRHTLTVRAVDADGRWGGASTVL